MEALEERIYRDGHFLPGGILKVDSFVNHQVDTRFMMEVGHEVAHLFKDEPRIQYDGGLLQYPLPLIHQIEEL